LMAVGLSLGAVVASFASAALGWRFQAALGVVVVEERGGRVVELACFVVGDPGGVTVGRVREDGHTLVLAGGWRARPVSGVGLFLGGQCRAFAFGLVDVDRGRLFCGRPRPSGAIAARIFCVSAGGVGGLSLLCGAVPAAPAPQRITLRPTVGVLTPFTSTPRASSPTPTGVARCSVRSFRRTFAAGR
jgi:hypothetical protein